MHTPSSSDFKEFNPQGYHLRIPKNCPTARDHLYNPVAKGLASFVWTNMNEQLINGTSQ